MKWHVVKDEPDADDSYDHLSPVAGPFDTFAEARAWIAGDDRFLPVQR